MSFLCLSAQVIKVDKMGRSLVVKSIHDAMGRWIDCNSGYCMYCDVRGMVHVKDPMLIHRQPS